MTRDAKEKREKVSIEMCNLTNAAGRKEDIHFSFISIPSDGLACKVEIIERARGEGGRINTEKKLANSHTRANLTALSDADDCRRLQFNLLWKAMTFFTGAFIQSTFNSVCHTYTSK